MCWHRERRLRVTASRAHKIVNGRKEETRQKYFFETGPDLPSMQYGRSMEDRARAAFENIQSCKVSKSGLIVRSDQSWIACSPDGIYRNPAGHLVLLEIKVIKKHLVPALFFVLSCVQSLHVLSSENCFSTHLNGCKTKTAPSLFACCMWVA